MGRGAYVFLVTLGLLSVILIGAGVPIASIYYTVNYGLSAVVASIISFLALLCAGILGFFIFVFVFEEHGSDLLREEMSPSDKEKLNLLRAHLRATLEELDEIGVLLKDIHDVLKEAGG
jgi:hypothetical protein